MSAQPPEPWLGEGSGHWFNEAESWIREVFHARDLGSPVEIERVKARPWSVVLRAQSRGTLAWFKAAGTGGVHEPRLLRWLGERRGVYVPALLEVHASQPWMLMVDGGGRPPEDADIASLLRQILPAYAELQIASSSRVDDLLALGLPDRVPARLPGMLRELISAGAPASRRYADLLQELRPRIDSVLPALETRCSELDASPIPSALDHGDLHGANLLVGDLGLCLCDWGDASITHPFCSLLVTLRMTFGDSPDSEGLRRARDLRDAYLEPWTARAPLATLRSEFEQALWIAHVVRVCDWVHMLPRADAASFAQWSPHVVEELSRWLEHRELLA